MSSPTKPSAERERQPRTYYLAGSFDRRPELRILRDRLERELAGWRCASRWLEIEPGPGLGVVEIATIDATDVLNADAVVLVLGPPYSTGKHCELGIALAGGIPVYPVLEPWNPNPDPEPCIFTTLIPKPVPVSALIASGLCDIDDQTTSARHLADSLQRPAPDLVPHPANGDERKNVRTG